MVRVREEESSVPCLYPLQNHWAWGTTPTGPGPGLSGDSETERTAMNGRDGERRRRGEKRKEEGLECSP